MYLNCSNDFFVNVILILIIYTIDIFLYDKYTSWYACSAQISTRLQLRISRYLRVSREIRKSTRHHRTLFSRLTSVSVIAVTRRHVRHAEAKINWRDGSGGAESSLVQKRITLARKGGGLKFHRHWGKRDSELMSVDFAPVKEKRGIEKA